MTQHDLFPNAQHSTPDGAPVNATTATPLVLTVEQAAERLGVGRTLMYALVRSGAVESVTIGRLRRVPADALDAFLQRLRAGEVD